MDGRSKNKGFLLLDTLWACTLLALGSLLFCGHWTVLVRLLARQEAVEQASRVALACLYHKENELAAEPGFTVESTVEPAGLSGVTLRKVTVYGPEKNVLCTFARFEET